MSLTSELTGGPLADWFAAGFPGRSTAADIAADLARRSRCAPPPGVLGSGHWPAVGGAVGTRLAWAVEPAPPYYALYGSHNAGLIGWDAAHQAATAFPTHRPGPDGPPTSGSGALAWRPTPTGWVEVAAPAAQQPARPQDGTHAGIVGDFAARAAAFLDRVPPGGFGTPGEETVLARVALVLGDWEQAYRRGPQALPRATQAALEQAATRGDSATLLASVDPAALADTTALITDARRRGLLDQLADTVGTAVARGHAFPTFAEQWADGDLLLTPGHGAPTTLIDVKTVMSAREPSTVRRWLWQLLGYAYLADLACPEWRLGRVGLCFARHGHVVAWDVDELAGLMAERPARGGFARDRDGFERAFRRTLAVRGLQAS